MTDDEIDTLSQLCQIEITDAERKELSDSIDQMLDYFAIMSEFSDDSEPQARHRQTLGAQPEPREAVDTPSGHDYTEQAPETESDFFVVPNVI